ncbi:MAG: hypothetical protein RLZZ385_1263 [Pseudomonadota bacterium]|jgi:uncharacterized membrane protein YdjX (TVP38/TMEM64 family)
MTATTTKRRHHKALVLGLTVLVLVAVSWYANQYVSLDELARQEAQLRDYIALNGWRAMLLGFGVYLALAFIPGTGGKAIVWGWLFGFWPALITVSLGLTIAAMCIFWLSRYLFQEAIERRYASFLLLMNNHLEKEGAFYLLTLRMAHAPFSIVNPVSGASRVRSWTFLWTTFIGLLPANVIWIVVGIRLPSLHELAAAGAASFIDLPLVLALIGCALLPVVVRWLVSRFSIPGADGAAHDATIQQSQKERMR